MRSNMLSVGMALLPLAILFAARIRAWRRREASLSGCPYRRRQWIAWKPDGVTMLASAAHPGAWQVGEITPQAHPEGERFLLFLAWECHNLTILIDPAGALVGPPPIHCCARRDACAHG